MTRKLLATLGILALAVLVVAGALTAGLGTAGAQTTDAPTDRTIGVSANGEASAAPDEAVVRLAVTATGDDPATVRDDLAAEADALRSGLDDLGVEYETTDYRLGEHRRHEERPDIPQYQGSHGFEVTIDDPDRAGAIVDVAAEAGASIQQVRLTLSDDRRAQLRDTAIGNAMQDARHQASTIAAAGDLRVVGVHSVDASERSYRPVAYESAAGGGDGGGSTTIESGDVSVTYQVSVIYNATGA